ncbi:MAG TPA: hypothetical protein VIY26_16115 [Acidimicrobiales bacterium]
MKATDAGLFGTCDAIRRQVSNEKEGRYGGRDQDEEPAKPFDHLTSRRI